MWHYASPGEPGFSALFETGGEIRWYHCMECGDYYTLRWSGDRYVLD